MNDEERTLLLSLLEYLVDFLNGTLSDWGTEYVKLELNPDSKPFNSRYYPLPRINKETFLKELKSLIERGMVAPVQKSQYITLVFIIPNK